MNNICLDVRIFIGEGGDINVGGKTVKKLSIEF